jgi:uncharacterized repeat protein (TIGR03803 family)
MKTNQCLHRRAAGILLSLVLSTIGNVAGGQTFQLLYSFQDSDGSGPEAGLVQGTDGNYYGTTTSGGANSYGTVFRLTPDGALTTLASFDLNNGASPAATLVQGNEGNFYGTTGLGGDLSFNSGYGYGTVFRMTPGGALTTLVSFDNSNNGAHPQGIIQASDGNLYGTTYGVNVFAFGGTNNGAVFKMTTNGALTTLLWFNGTNGARPELAGLVQGSDGNFYGATGGGGTNNQGTVFKVTPSGVLTTLVSFNGNNGSVPWTTLVQGSDGNFYGTTSGGGAFGGGTVFKLTPAGVLTTLVSFNIPPNQYEAGPWAGLVQASDGNFYGTTHGGNDKGTVFRLTSIGTLTTLVSFNGANGAHPEAGLVQGTDGNLYGTTYNGGAYTNGRPAGYGTVFRIVMPPPLITAGPQPTNLTVIAGGSATFTITATGSPLPAYQWRLNGVPISGATTSAYSIAVVSTNDAGAYSVTVSNPHGTVISSNAYLVVIPTVPLPFALNNTSLTWTTDPPPSWYGQSSISHDGVASAQSGAIGDSRQTSLRTLVTGPGTLTFWWKVSSQANGDFLGFSTSGANPTNSARISGEVDWTQLSYYLAAGAQTLQWTYSKDASGSAGLDAGWVDQVSYVSGATQPIITSQPIGQTIFIGTPVTFNVSASGTPPLSYVWRLNGVPINGATQSTLTLASSRAGDAGVYSVGVANAYGSILSSNAVLGMVPIAGFGNNAFGQAAVPGSAAGAVAVAAGSWHSLALRADGSVVAWGDNFNGQCDVPTNLAGAVTVAAGGYHSLALKANGTVVGWGGNDYGQATAPAGLSNALAIAAGAWHSLALRADGTVAAWGDDSWGQSDVPPGLSNVIAIAASGGHSLALRANGTVVAWGQNTDSEGVFVGQSSAPLGLTNAAAVGAGEYFSLAALVSGAVVAWGDNSRGQSQPPPGLASVTALAGGGTHTVALKADRTVSAWGGNDEGQCNVPASLTNAIAVAAGSAHTLVLVDLPHPAPQILPPIWNGSQFTVVVQTVASKHYTLEYKNSLAATNWTALTALRGDGTQQRLVDVSATSPQRFYRVRQW